MIFVLFGPSGCGKTTVAELLQKDNYTEKLITDTTRLPRENEKDGVDYHFRTKDEFFKDVESGKYLEYAEYSGNYYGSRIESFQKMLKEKKHIVITMNIDGVKRIKKEFPNESIAVFIYTSLDKLEERMRLRGDSEDKIKERIQNIYETKELENIVDADYVIPNDSTKEELIAMVDRLKKSVE